jgi:signal transduction histidine kinase
VALSLQSAATTATGPGTQDRLTAAISEIDDIIREVRSAIYSLGMMDGDRGVRASLLSLVHELTPVVGFEVPVSLDGPIDLSVPDTVTPHLLAIVIEALMTNVGRRAPAPPRPG